MSKAAEAAQKAALSRPGLERSARAKGACGWGLDNEEAWRLKEDGGMRFTQHRNALSAIRSGDQKRLAQSLADGARPDGEDAESLLFEALSLDRWGMAQTLLDAGADINAPCGRERAPLLLKAAFEISEPARCMAWILERGGDANARFLRRSALEWAIIHEDEPAADTLLRFGANASEASAKGETMLMLAAEEGKPAFVKMLLAAGADWRAVDKEGRSALDHARQAAREFGAEGAAAEAALLAWEEQADLTQALESKSKQITKSL